MIFGRYQRQRLWIAAIAFLAIASALPGCTCSRSSKGEQKQSNADPPTHTVVIAGDFTFARRVNEAMFASEKRAALFDGKLTRLLQKADLAIVNGEGVISLGGQFTDKNEPMPYMYHVHPNMIDALTMFGIDVVSVGNNHTGDYGKAAFTEMLDRLVLSGISYTGGGYNSKDAAIPAYRMVGDTIVAIVGANLAYTEITRATETTPGTLFFESAHEGKNEEEIVREFTRILQEARQYAHLVLFTPHWGDNWKKEPTRAVRRLASRLIRAGYDAIVGHSAHVFQGVELIDGKPVIYDAGNLTTDYSRNDDSRKALLWALEISRAGVHRIKGYPIWLEKNHTSLAKGGKRDLILQTLKDFSKKLDTDIAIDHGVATIKCRAHEVRNLKSAAPPPKRPIPEGIRIAPSDAIIDVLPKGAVKVNVRYEEGIRLIGYQLLANELPIPNAAQVVALYWTTEQQIKDDYKVHLEARGIYKKSTEPYVRDASHLPGDWLVPTTQWPVGKIIQDWTLFRLADLKPEGDLSFFVGLEKDGLLAPQSSDRPLVDDKLLYLGKATYREKAPQVFEVLSAYRKKQEQSANSRQ